MTAALADAGVTTGEVGCINAHATSTPAGDPPEVWAIKRALGDRAAGVPVSSTKSVTGHLLGAAGAMGAAAAVMALVHQTLPPTINLDAPDPDLDLDFVPNRASEARLDVALVNSFGFGGNNAALVFRWAAQPAAWTCER